MSALAILAVAASPPAASGVSGKGRDVNASDGFAALVDTEAVARAAPAPVGPGSARTSEPLVDEPVEPLESGALDPPEVRLADTEQPPSSPTIAFGIAIEPADGETPDGRSESDPSPPRSPSPIASEAAPHNRQELANPTGIDAQPKPAVALTRPLAAAKVVSASEPQGGWASPLKLENDRIATEEPASSDRSSDTVIVRGQTTGRTATDARTVISLPGTPDRRAIGSMTASIEPDAIADQAASKTANRFSVKTSLESGLPTPLQAVSTDLVATAKSDGAAVSVPRVFSPTTIGGPAGADRRPVDRLPNAGRDPGDADPRETTGVSAALDNEIGARRAVPTLVGTPVVVPATRQSGLTSADDRLLQSRPISPVGSPRAETLPDIVVGSDGSTIQEDGPGVSRSPDPALPSTPAPDAPTTAKPVPASQTLDQRALDPAVAPLDPATADATEPAVSGSQSPTAADVRPAAPSETGLSGMTRAGIETTAQLAAQITRRLEGRTTRFDMALTPDGLGRVDVSLEIDADGHLAARLVFDNPLAATDLRGRADELRRQLEDAGFTLARDALDFAERDPSSGGGGFDRRRHRESAYADRSAAVETEPVAPTAPRRSLFSQTPMGVDMKV